MAFALGEEGDEHIRAGHLLASRILDVDDGTLDDPLETGGRLGVLDLFQDQAGQLVIDVFVERGAQFIDVDVAGAHDRTGVLVVAKREQQVLQRGIFVLALVGGCERAMQALFESGRE